MAEPKPPSTLPNYLAEGLPKQDDATLQDVREYITALLEYRDRKIGDDDLPDDSEIVDQESSGKGTIVKQGRKCGDETCHCADGELHGPYLYRYYREGGKLRSEYVGKP
ncbi:Uncharacterized protein HSRCO_3034 (plasmid) [Halanaeroarchaeum sp. HSR-CO]|uniref:DUF6788 family protein n=1 Tax=Halanaeroarchaeum sp. HSR-CO TaxID=2866382 RepID=UPI00217E9C07|nr:DUF6788 family protein [Halanaeroarchaeum sp. HSR-CO]UWG49175.1 Uncharacterized protein HSRCO_3034 [Halanaeroarchaeum sp. HSR-CO]